ncbi:hypothetical protein LTR62_004793 [Meristemomyces frigidus]|uniref:Mitochondrial import inner membrane translocase subunit Tim21 n=1 Tax=Meristemomyces frigidus TaxID=1508187 RepID=A0AAN7YJQ6_9PEZI|nr:hypothetical protein LTR62_004793 [Meristemomyces frigidus]
MAAKGILISPALVLRLGTRSSLPSQAIRHTRFATTDSLPKDTSVIRHRRVTVTNDTGAVPWKHLSLGEKAARATQQSFNLSLILVGITLTGAVGYVLYLEVFSTDSKTAIFNRAADQVRKDTRCIELLAGDEGLHTKREIKAYGEPSWSRWARNRTIASRNETDRAGVEHMHMHFYVEGPAAKGTVNVHMVRVQGQKDFVYKMLAVDVPGQKRYFLEGGDGILGGQRSQGRMFGVRWN